MVQITNMEKELVLKTSQELLDLEKLARLLVKIWRKIIMKLKNIALSTGSACHDNIKKPSAVLTAMKVPEEIALGAVRFSLGKYNTEEEIDFTIKEIEKVIGGRK